MPQVIVSNIDSSLSNVLFVSMSSVQDDIQAIKKMAKKTLKTSFYIMAPLMIGLAITAPEVIKLLLTDKWISCVPYVRIFCIYYLFTPILTVNLNAIISIGKSALFLKIEFYKKITTLIILLLTMWFGVKVMAYCLLIESLIQQIIGAFPNKKLISYSYVEQIKDILPNLFLALFMGICVYFIHFVQMNDLIKLFLQILIGGIVYITGSAIFKLESFVYLIEILKLKK